jgi:metal-dependent amidase/aminoacylase/carboxypeptidase family protein
MYRKDATIGLDVFHISLTGESGHEPTLAVAMVIILDQLNTKLFTQAQTMHAPHCGLAARLPGVKF